MTIKCEICGEDKVSFPGFPVTPGPCSLECAAKLLARARGNTWDALDESVRDNFRELARTF